MTGRWLIAARVGIVLTFVAVLLRPGFGERAVPTELSDVEVLVVVDRTRSMAALDYQGQQPRIVGVQADLFALADELPGARFGLLSFDSEVQLLLPFTSDTTTFMTAVETLTVAGLYQGAASRPDRPLEELEEILERAEEQHPERRRMLVYIGDGENTEGGDVESFDAIEEYVDGGVVLGYGTEEGGRMPQADDLSTDDGYVQDMETGEDALSHLDPENLQRIADDLDIEYVHRQAPGGMSEVAADFEAQYQAAVDEDTPAEHDLTWVFGLILLGLVLVELRHAWRALWTARSALQPPKEATS